MKKYLIDQDQMTYLLQILECYPMMRDELDRIKPVEPQEEIDDLKYELSVAREAQQCECSSDDACRFARERDALQKELEAEQLFSKQAMASVIEIAAQRDALKADIEKLRTVMFAAAVEITSHWDAHCDAEGFGPVNLVRRLENGFPSRYGYDAQTLVRVEKEVAALKAELAALTQQSFDLCPQCGWRTFIPGDGCLNCPR